MRQDDVKRDGESSPPVADGVLKLSWAFLGVLWVFVILIILQPYGFAEKTAWDWLELLIVPIILTIIAYFFSSYQRQVDREIADKERDTDREIARARNEEEELRAYFDRMAELMLEYDLRSQPAQSIQDTAEENDNPAPVEEANTTNNETAATIARARTLAVLRSIQDPVRKGSVVRFLYESKLIDKEKPVVNLQGADLEVANLQVANLAEANLAEADLTEANLEGANLHGANLQWADLSGADLGVANLRAANLQGADLSGADLRAANLAEANLVEANLAEANLAEANLAEADLTEANLTEANLHGANLSEANLKGAKLYFARMQEANLYGAKLQGTHLQGANLEGTNLEGVQTDEHTNFENVRYNNKTTPPPGGFPASAVNVDEE